MKTAIITVGTEILFGQILNTNVQYISEKLNLYGFDVLYHYTVGDNPKRLGGMISDALEKNDLVITTGGLGPTKDDLTKEIIAETLGEEMILHQEALDSILKYFKSRGYPMTENNKKQAYFPKNASLLQNSVGTAPGFMLEKNGKIVVALPGPPSEMKEMFDNELLPRLEEKSEGTIRYKIIKTIGIGEAAMEEQIMDLIDSQEDVTIAPYAHVGEAYLRVAAKRKTAQEAEEAIRLVVDKIMDRLGDYVYSTNGEDIGQVVLRLLKEKGLTISSAESCTGGLFADSIISCPGASDVFDRSLVTYSNRAKHEELSVSEETLSCFGAVSAETAIEMAKGVRKVSGSDIGISVTGIAGPDGGSKEKPVGLVYIGISTKEGDIANKYNFGTRARDTIRKRSVLVMLQELLKLLKGDANEEG